MHDEQIKKNIQALIDDFRTNYQEYKKESEASIETKLIEPLFRLLDWTEKDFKKRERTQRGGKRGFADYTFYIGDKKVFFLEVKKIGIPLDKEADTQVVSYALSKSVPIAISTNFEELKVFCVEEENLDKRKIIVFNNPDEYITEIHDLLLLSKSSFEQNLLLKKAENLGLLKKRITIDKPLLDDLILIRKFIADDIENTYKTKYQPNEKEEITQRIIDRLIFIRKCEDTGINPENLILKDAIAVPDNKAYSKLKEIFEKYNDVYNSGLFAIEKDNDCDKITINGGIIKKLIGYLYTSKNEGYVYNFEWIPDDILGQVYELYLGKILKQTKSGKAKLKNGQAHRKEQGIYYTPTYIVDYIVKNTVGETLKNKKIKVKDIKVLDPACGSGSFLIKAFDYLYNDLSGGKDSTQYRIDSQGKYSIKTEILKNNLYGVDLDNKAVEITKLNLLLKAAEKNRRLPEEIDLHIKHGNSLIDDETIAVSDSFKWEGDFWEGSFDVIIGNPPYGIVFKENEKHFIEEKLPTFKRNNDLFVAFTEKAINLLKEKGLFSFIVPNTYLIGSYFDNLKRLILDKTKIIKIIDLGTNHVFQDPNVFNSIIVLQKESNTPKREKNIIEFYDVPLLKNSDFFNFERVSINTEIIQSQFNDLVWKPKNKIIDKINKKKDKVLGEICYVKDVGFNYWSIGRGKKRGGSIGSKVLYDGEQKNKNDIPYLKGRDIIRYNYIFGNHWLKYDYENFLDKQVDVFRFSQEFLEASPKIIYRQTSDRIIATVDFNKYYLDKTVHLIIPKENIQLNMLYSLGILNSKLMSYFYRDMVREEGRTFAQVKTIYIKKIPLIFDKQIENKISELVKRQLEKTKNLNEIGDKKTSESAKLEEEISKTDNEIDQLVYRLYGLTKKEIDIVEKSLE